MASDQARELRQQGIQAAKNGHKELARKLLQQSIRLEPNHEAAWLWLASVARDQRERLFCLQKILEINPNNEQAQKAILALQEQSDANASSAAGLKRITPTGSQPAVTPRLTTQEIMAQAPGVPLPSDEAVAAAERTADALLRDLQSEARPAVRWVKKGRGRAGEQDVWRVRASVGLITLAVLAVACGLGYVVVANTPALARVVFAATPTQTTEPTQTFTPTPGATPTPSTTPRLTPQPSATIAPEVPTSDVLFSNPTPIYPSIFDVPLREAIALLNSGRADQALPTLAAVRANTSASFDPNPYYFEALAYVSTGDLGSALRTLREAERRLDERPLDNFQPLVDLGFAAVAVAQAEAARAQGDRPGVEAALAEAQTRAASAAAGDPRLAQAHVLHARALALADENEQALEILDAALEIPALRYDTNLIVEKARIYFRQRNYSRAAEQAALALYIDRWAESAHQIGIEAALARNRPGEAVLLTQAYLFYFPGSAEGYRLLGQARSDEGNYDLALAAYDRALSVEQDQATTIAALVGRAAVYTAQRRPELALEDLSRALRLKDTDPIRLLRMQAAYAAGSYATARTDVTRLEGSPVLTMAELALVSARILIDEAEAQAEPPPGEVYDQLQAARTNASAATRALIDEYEARAYYLDGDYDQALSAVDLALSYRETGFRRYLRGLILQADRQTEAAIGEFEWVLAWSHIYPFPFRAEVEERLAELR